MVFVAMHGIVHGILDVSSWGGKFKFK